MDLIMDIMKNPKVRCKNIANVEKKIRRIFEDGISSFMVITDFDYTISRYHNSKGEECWTSYGVFETGLSESMNELYRKCEVLKAKYLPIEFDPHMSIAEKIPYMEKWWDDAHNYIIESRLTKANLENCVKHSRIELRDNAESFFATLSSNDVPIIIFSAGIGNVIDIFLQQKFSKVPDNVHVISNMMEFDDDGYASRFLLPLIHTFCKNASVIGSKSHLFESVIERKNVLLMGDSLGDLDMDKGVVNKGEVLKIGFLNFNADALLEKYMDGYDIVLLDDQSFDIPLKIINSIPVHLESFGSRRKLCKFIVIYIRFHNKVFQNLITKN
uniref:5'-nucleotidase n=1 Tax=Syphacia muris TaxID=451379 RepID=A0A0N5B0V3_9BILA